MHLKRLDIFGFKSFADKTTLHFDHGITGIVGPNGCGKSNISDAFRWVLGEQSPKSMRGSKMPDVIFAGTSQRKPLNFAEVTITLSDIDGKLPTEYDEISVTRRLHRSGESDYFINKNPVRLKDVQNLFLDSGIGKDAYSIFEQGKIDQVINFSPLERRYIFEEAAGILRFLNRKKEALRKLELADNNISRVKDIHQEVERQIVVLEEQAEKAKIYKDNKTLLEQLEKAILFTRWSSLQVKIAEINKKGADRREEIVISNQHLESLSLQFQESKDLLKEDEKLLRIKNEEVFNVRSSKEIKTREKQGNQDRLAEILTKEKRWQHELALMVERRRARQVEKATLVERLQVLEQEIALKEKTLASQRDEVQKIEQLLKKLREEQQGNQQELLLSMTHYNKSEGELKQTIIRLENVQERHLQQQNRLDVLEKISKELTKNIEEKKKQVEDLSRIIDELKLDFSKKEQSLQVISTELQNVHGEINEVQLEITEGRARQKVLLKLREEMEGFSVGTKRLLQESANPISSFYNKLRGLYEVLAPKKGQEKVLGSALRPYSQTLIVESQDDFNKVVAFAKQENLKDFSLFCCETAMGGLSNNISESLSKHFLDRISTPKEEITSGILQGKLDQEVYLEEGIFIDHRHVIFFSVQGENNVFIREAELKALSKKLEGVENKKIHLDTVLKGLQQRKNQLQQERFELDKNIRQHEMKLVEGNFGLQKFMSDYEKTVKEHKALASELQSLIASIEKLSTSLDELKTQSQKAFSKVSESQNRADKINKELEGHMTIHKQLIHILREMESVFNKFCEEKRHLLHSSNVLEVKDLESKQQEKRLEEEIEMCQALQSDSSFKEKEYQKILQEVETSLADALAAFSELEQGVAAKKTIIEHVESKINDKRKALQKLEMEENQYQVQAAQMSSQSQLFEKELQERFQLSIEEAKESVEPLEKSLEATEKRIRALRQEMQSAGDVNMTSIEECDKYKVRHDFLRQQLDDLNVSKKELVNIITQLDVESRKIFKETFDKISVNFKKNFSILFNGGEADLQFTETADLLEAGIEIIAKPPGKQMRSINLLSGGEKCLTALALLFAIFEVKPSPFCILDEIDAPLDDTNVERFVNIVKRYMESCQFIIITHNKRTMAIADVLFGVSMETKGVSKILSMEFAHAE